MNQRQKTINSKFKQSKMMHQGYRAQFPNSAQMMRYDDEEDMDGDEFDDMDDYGLDDDDYGDYDEEESMTDAEMLAQARMQQQARAMPQQMKAASYSGPGSAPPAKIGSSLYGGGAGIGMGGAGSFQAGVGQIGQMGGAGAFGSGLAPSSGIGGGGGFTYGMASQGAGSGGIAFGQASAAGGAPFGSQPTGAMAKAKTAPTSIFGASTLAGKPGAPSAGGLTFGGASQFGAIGGGGIGSGSMPGGLGGGGGDAYSGTVIDLDKIKASAPKTKPFEAKSEEEKKADADARGTSKSNLKTSSGPSDKAKKGVSFGRSTTYEFEDSDEDGGVTNKDNIERKGSPRPSKVVDLSDARTESEKAQAALDEEQKRITEQFKKANEWKKQQAEKTAALEPPKKSPEKDIESSGLSSSMSISQSRSATRKVDDVDSSYSSSGFEEVSMSGSGSKNSSSLQAMRARASGGKARDVIESSATYDDDFDSMTMSKSLQQVEIKKVSDAPSHVGKAAMKKLPSLKDRSPSVEPVGTGVSVASKYVKKDNKGVQTDVGKYSYTDSTGQTFKEKSLSSELQEAELLIQDLKFQQSADRDEVHKMEVQLKKKQGEHDTARREAMSANESFKRQVDKLKEVTHQNHLYKIEVESLIRQIEMADTKAREMSDELNTKEAEFNRKLEQQQERILYRKGKKEESEVSEMRREHAIQLAEERQRVEDRQEDADLLKEKVLKLEGENEKLRMARDNNKVTRKLQEEIEALKAQIPKSTSAVDEADGFKKNLSADEQVSLQKDRAQLEKICQGYANANQKASQELYDLRERVKRLSKELDGEKKNVDTLRKQALERTERVFIEKEQDEVDMHTANLLGVSGAITHKQLKNLHEKLNEQRNEIDDLKRESSVKEGHLKSINNQTRDEKFRIERQLIDTELLVKDKELEFKSLKENSSKERDLFEQKINDLKEKISWYGENQKLITAQSGDVKSQQNMIRDLQAQVKEMEIDSRKCRDLEKRNKLLEETIKSRNPNSMPMLIQAAKDVHEKEADNDTVKKLRFKVTQLEGQLDQNDQDFQKRLRGLQQEMERQKQIYEKRTKNPDEARKVSELENELHKTKSFYQKRIAEIEKQKGFKVEQKQTPRKNADLALTPSAKEREQEIVTLNSEVAQLTAQIIQITKERDFFAQKNVNTAHKQQLRENKSQEKIDTIDASEAKQHYFHPFEPKTTPARKPMTSWNDEEEISGSRTTTDLLQDLSKVHNLRSLLPKKAEYIKITQFIQLLASQQMIVSKNEMLSLKKFLDDQSDCVHDGDVITVDDLLEAIEDYAPQRPVAFHPAPASFSEDHISLKRKIDRLQRDKDDDQDFYNAKIRQLKRRVTDCMMQNKELDEEVAKLTGQKQHLEKFFKQKMGVSMKTGVAPGDTQGDVNYMMRRLEFLEDQSDERNRSQRNEHAPCRREIERLTAEIDCEKAERGKIMAKKNSEIAGFKAELDTLLTELANQQARASNSAIYN